MSLLLKSAVLYYPMILRCASSTPNASCVIFAIDGSTWTPKIILRPSGIGIVIGQSARNLSELQVVQVIRCPRSSLIYFDVHRILSCKAHVRLTRSPPIAVLPLSEQLPPASRPVMSRTTPSTPVLPSTPNIRPGTSARANTPPPPLKGDLHQDSPPIPHDARRRGAEQRALTLRSDPLLGDVEPNRVFCILCQKWVRLRQDSSYCAYPWLQHRGKCLAKR